MARGMEERFRYGAALAAGIAVGALACGSAEDSASRTVVFGNEAAAGGDGGGTGSDPHPAGGGGTGGSPQVTVDDDPVPDDGGDVDETCAQTEAEALLERRPVDIIIAIDNSSSMSSEAYEVEEQINSNFTAILNSAVPAIDYRVIMLSEYGDTRRASICVAAPLGGIPDADQDGHCDSYPPEPVNAANFYHHAVRVTSSSALKNFYEAYAEADDYGLQPGGYQSVLRQDSFKFFLVITDDSPAAKASDWDEDLLTLSPAHFGTADNRNYSFWTITGMAPFAGGEPHPPDEAIAPVITETCTPSAASPGVEYQKLSIMTGGCRFPSCGLDYTIMFRLMAEGVIQGSKVQCEFAIPEAPPGEVLDLETVEVRYSSAGVELESFRIVAGVAECDPTSFYVDGDVIKLCPETCAVVQADSDAELKVLYGCVLPPVR
jgi:hypothetical protein